MLQSMGLQRVGHDLATEHTQTRRQTGLIYVEGWDSRQLCQVLMVQGEWIGDSLSWRRLSVVRDGSEQRLVCRG